jgi:general secretion pathway protein D
MRRLIADQRYFGLPARPFRAGAQRMHARIDAQGPGNARIDLDKVLPQREYSFGDPTLFWSILNEKVDGFIEFLQSYGSVEVLSRPQILASDNKQAQINVGQSVPFVTRVQTTESGSSINTIQYQDIGILLNVTPHINPEGYVNMDIAPQISGFADSTVNVGENVQASVFTNRSAQTTVAVQDGQTIVIGGLMTNEDRKTVREVPGLSKNAFLENLRGHVLAEGVLMGTYVR